MDRRIQYRKKRKELLKKKKEDKRIIEEEPVRIFNLSSHVLSEDEGKILGKGLKFALTDRGSKFERYVDLQRFIRRLTLKKNFKKKVE